MRNLERKLQVVAAGSRDAMPGEVNIQALLPQNLLLSQNQKLVQAAEQVDFSTLSAYVSSGSVGFSHSRTLRIHESTCSWNQYYPVLTFLFSGHLYADYIRMSEWLGLLT